MTTDDVAVCRIVASNNGQVKLNGQPWRHYARQKITAP